MGMGFFSFGLCSVLCLILIFLMLINCGSCCGLNFGVNDEDGFGDGWRWFYRVALG